MTITRQLEINVLTAPVATADRRCLSQAWYSALYAQRATRPPRSKTIKAQAALSSAAPARSSAAFTHAGPAPAAGRKAAAAARVPQSAGALEFDRRAPRSRLARSIERTFSTPQPSSAGVSFTVDGIAGRVRVLLRRNGCKTVLIAICGRGARPQVRAALEQARYALAAKGVALQAEVREC